MEGATLGIPATNLSGMKFGGCGTDLGKEVTTWGRGTDPGGLFCDTLGRRGTDPVE